jgi:hypothetical protein
MHRIQLHTSCIPHYHILRVGVSLGLIACGSHSPASVAVTPTKTTAAITDSVERRQLSVFHIYEPGQLNYDVHVHSSLQPTAGDSVHRSDSTQVSSIIRIHFVPASTNGQLLAQIQIDSTILRTTDNSSTQLAPGIFTFRITTQGRQLLSRTKIDCSDTTTTTLQLPVQGSEVLPTLESIDTDHCVDTSVVEICRGTVAINLTRIATYTVITQNLTTNQVIRTTDMTMQGSGHQWGQRVSVTGRGTAIDTLSITESRLQQITGNARLEMAFDSLLRHQQYIQTTSTQITLRH